MDILFGCLINFFVLVIALVSLCFGLIHTFSMLIAFNGYAEGKKMDQAMVPAVHVLASLMV